MPGGFFADSSHFGIVIFYLQQSCGPPVDRFAALREKGMGARRGLRPNPASFNERKDQATLQRGTCVRVRGGGMRLGLEGNIGGEAGIRTLGGVTPTLDFESSPFGRSGTSPNLAGLRTGVRESG